MMEGDALGDASCNGSENGEESPVRESEEGVPDPDEDWTEVPKQRSPCIGYFPPVHRVVASPGPLALSGSHLALSVSAVTGRFWRGAVALGAVPDSPGASQIEVKALCELPSGLGDLAFLGRHDRLMSGHDDGCVSILAMEEAEEKAEEETEEKAEEKEEKSARKLRPVGFAMEHDSPVQRLSYAGERAVSLEDGGRVKLWLLEPFVSVHSFQAFPFSGADLALHPGRPNLLAGAGRTHGAPRCLSLGLWDLRDSDTGTTARPCGGVLAADEGGPEFCALTWCPADDDWLFAGDRSGGLSLFDLRQMKEALVRLPKLHSGWPVERLAASGAQLFSLGQDRRLFSSEVFADEGGIARLRPSPGAKPFRHSSMALGLAANERGWWSSEISGAVWRSTSQDGPVTLRLDPPLQVMEF